MAKEGKKVTQLQVAPDEQALGAPGPRVTRSGWKEKEVSAVRGGSGNRSVNRERNVW